MKFTFFIFIFLWSVLAHALSLRPDSPKEYVVQRGDTLWSIANKYLKNPWEWKELWRANPQIKNPNHLYAGAVLALDYYQEKPYLHVLSNGRIKLSPTLHPTPLDDLIPPIPLEDVKPFLDESLILDEDVLGHAPYIVALMPERMLGGQGDPVYVKGLHPSPKLPEGGTIAYSIFRSARTFIDPISNEVLGYQAKMVGFGELLAGGEPATLLLTNIKEGIKIEDKVLINDTPEFSLYFEPSAPTNPVRGLILEMPTNMPRGNSQGAVGSIIILNIGVNAGLKAGDVLGVFAKPRIVPDPKNHLNSIKLPPERLGEAMIFRPFTKTSFALIVRSTRAVYVLDTVGNP